MILQDVSPAGPVLYLRLSHHSLKQIRSPKDAYKQCSLSKACIIELITVDKLRSHMVGRCIYIRNAYRQRLVVSSPESASLYVHKCQCMSITETLESIQKSIHH